jgi:hypothetical protein
MLTGLTEVTGARSAVDLVEWECLIHLVVVISSPKLRKWVSISVAYPFAPLPSSVNVSPYIYRRHAASSGSLQYWMELQDILRYSCTYCILTILHSSTSHTHYLLTNIFLPRFPDETARSIFFFLPFSVRYQ